MLYCPPNVTFSQVWINNGISHCFMDTIGNAVASGFLLLMGTIQLLMYRKYATRNDPTHITKSRLYALQLFLLFFFPILALVRFFLNARVYNDHAIYGYMILSTVLICISYPFSVCVILKERFYQLPSLPTRGHGLILLLFWTLGFINESLAFINLRHEDWWFSLKTGQRIKFQVDLKADKQADNCINGRAEPNTSAQSLPLRTSDDESYNETNSYKPCSVVNNDVDDDDDDEDDIDLPLNHHLNSSKARLLDSENLHSVMVAKNGCDTVYNSNNNSYNNIVKANNAKNLHLISKAVPPMDNLLNIDTTDAVNMSTGVTSNVVTVVTPTVGSVAQPLLGKINS